MHNLRIIFPKTVALPDYETIAWLFYQKEHAGRRLCQNVRTIKQAMTNPM